MKAMFRRSMATLVGSVALMVAPAAFAEGEPCYNDDDCPNPACGGEVCNWGKMAAQPVGEKVYYCQPAGREPKGQDGWCTDTSDCKCKAEGATCVSVFCTATQPMSGTGGSGTGGTPGTAGSGTAAAGATSTSGATSTAGTTSTAGSGGSAPAEESSGCSTAAPVTTGGGIAFALGMVGLGAALSRRRRR